jgi:NTE family protein
MTRGNTERSIALLSDRDLLLVPRLGDLGTADFVKSMEAIPLGEAEARARERELARLSVTGEQWLSWERRRQRREPSRKPPVIAFIRIDNDPRISDAVLEARLGLKAGDLLDEEKLRKGIGRIYGMDLFKSVSYRLVEEEGEAGLVIVVKEKPWGPAYLDWGLKFFGSWNSGGGLSLGAGYTHTALNPLGGEYRLLLSLGEIQALFAEFYQPLSVEEPWFLNPKMQLQRRSIGYYQGGERVADYYFNQALLALEAGKELGNWGEFRVGYRYAYDDVEVRTGAEYLEDATYHEGSLFAQLAVDTLDNLYFPTRGNEGHFRIQVWNQALGGDHDFEQLSAFWTSANSWGANTLLLHGEATYSFGDEIPIYGHHYLGGFLRLSGYERYELSGPWSAMGFVGLLRRLNEPGAVVPIFAGGTLELGNVWQDSDHFGNGWIGAGSLFLGLDTYLGPLYLGFGAAEEGHRNAFIYLGAPF